MRAAEVQHITCVSNLTSRQGSPVSFNPRHFRQTRDLVTVLPMGRWIRFYLQDFLLFIIRHCVGCSLKSGSRFASLLARRSWTSLYFHFLPYFFSLHTSLVLSAVSRFFRHRRSAVSRRFAAVATQDGDNGPFCPAIKDHARKINGPRAGDWHSFRQMVQLRQHRLGCVTSFGEKLDGLGKFYFRFCETKI